MAPKEKKRANVIPDALPVLPLQEIVLYPTMAIPLLVKEERSIRLLKDAMSSGGMVAVVTQRDGERAVVEPEHLYGVGTAAVLLEPMVLQDHTLRVTVQGLERVRIREFVRREPYLSARVTPAPEAAEHAVALEAFMRSARSRFEQLLALSDELPDGLESALRSIEDPRQLAYFIAASAPLGPGARQEILELDSTPAKLRRLIELCEHEIAVRELMARITDETRVELSKAQEEHLLRIQLEAIAHKLGELESEEEEEEEEDEEARELGERLAETKLPSEARKEAERELYRLERTPEISPEYSIIRTYLDWLLKLPWGKFKGAPIELGRARAVLDEDHYDLGKIKDRIIDYLAVKRLLEQRRPEGEPGESDASSRALGERRVGGEPILCFLGPPGVGKTSLGQSIARSMGRSFARISLGGIHDEAEIRGHRRTYVGAMPGRILQALSRAEAADPVLMLDEVDKLGVGFHGDPSAALLEVLDPAQNHAFVDAYLGVPFDLSRVLFICTANTAETIPAPLLDRMEVLALSGYTDRDKLDIARRYLLPKQMVAHGLLEGELMVEEEALLRVIRDYTREAGVRGLERELSAILRKVARRVGEGAPGPAVVRAADVGEYLGPQRFFDEVAERLDRPGVATGLAWTEVGGELLFVEATVMPGGEERLILTGMLGDVMRESAQAALSYLRSNAERLGIDPRVFERKHVHVHVPAGAIPKDGPSAGVTILVALASQVMGRAARNDTAMTGEITLRGKVLPVGGIKEKVLAAHRAGIRRVLLPRHNEGALEDVPDEVRRVTHFVLVESADEVLSTALLSGEEKKAGDEKEGVGKEGIRRAA